MKVSSNNAVTFNSSFSTIPKIGQKTFCCAKGVVESACDRLKKLEKHEAIIICAGALVGGVSISNFALKSIIASPLPLPSDLLMNGAIKGEFSGVNLFNQVNLAGNILAGVFLLYNIRTVASACLSLTCSSRKSLLMEASPTMDATPGELLTFCFELEKTLQDGYRKSEHFQEFQDQINSIRIKLGQKNISNDELDNIDRELAYCSYALDSDVVMTNHKKRDFSIDRGAKLFFQERVDHLKALQQKYLSNSESFQCDFRKIEQLLKKDTISSIEIVQIEEGLDKVSPLIHSEIQSKITQPLLDRCDAILVSKKGDDSLCTTISELRSQLSKLEYYEFKYFVEIIDAAKMQLDRVEKQPEPDAQIKQAQEDIERGQQQTLLLKQGLLEEQVKLAQATLRASSLSITEIENKNKSLAEKNELLAQKEALLLTQKEDLLREQASAETLKKTLEDKLFLILQRQLSQADPQTPNKRIDSLNLQIKELDNQIEQLKSNIKKLSKQLKKLDNQSASPIEPPKSQLAGRAESKED